MYILVYILYKGVAIRHNLIYLIIKIHKFIEELSPMSKTYTNPETIGLHAGWRKDENTNSELAIVLLHGFGACKDHWRFNQKNISSIAPCYSLDLVGFGDSSKPTSQLLYEKKNSNNHRYCFDNWSQQVFDFCNEIVKKPVILIGNSIGGVIALRASQLLENQIKEYPEQYFWFHRRWKTKPN